MEPHEFKQLYAVTHANPLQNLIPLCSTTYKTHPSSTSMPVELPNHCLPHGNPSQDQEWSTSFCNKVLSNSQFHVPLPLHMFSPNTSSASTADEEREHRQTIINEKRLKRVISNRESARRSRMRKKKLIEELHSQVNQVQTINHQLSEKLIRLLESNHQILQENAQLKEKVSSLQILLTDLLTPLRSAEEVTGNINHSNIQIAEASSPSINH